MKVRRLKQDEISKSLDLVWRVFCKYEAVSYPESSKAAFWQAIHSADYLNMLTAYGAFDDSNRLVGIIATRDEGAHIALFFVDGDYQGQGIGRKLWNAMLNDNANNKITVHSSQYAVPIYAKLGFVKTGDIQIENGITFIPMVFEK